MVNIIYSDDRPYEIKTNKKNNDFI